METKSRLLAFVHDFFSKLEGFPPGPGIVTYDRLRAGFHHPHAGLCLEGATAVARCVDAPGRIDLSLAFELNETSRANRPIRLSIKGHFHRERSEELNETRERFKVMANRILTGFSAGLEPNGGASHPVAPAVGE